MRPRMLPALVLTLLLALQSLAAADDAPPAQPEAGWITLMTEDFEREFPHGLWHIGREGDPYLWGRRNCNPHTGTYSIWAGGGGPLGSQIPCTGMYTPGYVTTLSYGPVDLTGCTDVRVNFAHWTWLGPGDSQGVGFSNDGGVSWYLSYTGGNRVSVCGGWCVESLSEDHWKVPLCGKSRVYLLFRFQSDASGVSYGAFLDDISLEAYYEGMPPSTPTPTATATVTPTATRPPDADRYTYLPLILRR